MDNKSIGLILAIIIVIILIVAAFAFLNSNSDDGDKNMTISNNNGSEINFNKNNSSSENNGLLTEVKAPNKAKRGTNITATYTVKNIGDSDITNLEIADQHFGRTVNLLKPGESKSFDISYYLPTIEDLKADFGSDSIYPDVLDIGGATVTWNYKGKEYSSIFKSVNVDLT